jgi:hypothetical protein
MVNTAKEFARLVRAISQVSEPIANALTHLADRIEDVARELRDEQYHHYELENLVHQITERPRTRGEPGATDLEALLGQLLQGYHDHQDWLTSLSRQRTADRLTSGDYIVHQEISKRYRDLIGQQLLDVAAQAGPDGRFAEARIRAGLARALFQPASVQHGPEHAFTELSQNVVTMPADRFRSLWVTAEGIQHDAMTSGHSHSWVFDAEPGAAVNPVLQEPYEGCDPEDPVLFVVAPAYVVNGKVYVRQLVFTGRPSPAGEPPAAEPSAAEPSETAQLSAEASQADAVSPPDGPGPPPESLDLTSPGDSEATTDGTGETSVLWAGVAIGRPTTRSGPVNSAEPANPMV